MKQIIFFVATLLTLTSVKAQDSVFTYTHQGQTLYYIVDSNGEASVVPPLYPYHYFSLDTVTLEAWDGHTKPQGAVVVPDSVFFGSNNHPVTSIDFCAFYLCDSITSVTLPSTLRYIDSSAFEGCLRLETVALPSVDAIDYSAFYNCAALCSVTLPEGLTTIGGWAFSFCHNLQTVSFPSSLTQIGHHSFLFDTSLLALSIPSSVDTIHKYAFYLCTSLQSVSLPEGLSFIDSMAFGECYNLSSIIIPPSITSIPPGAFGLCENLQSVSLPEGLLSIGEDAFLFCQRLEHIHLPSSLTSIGDVAFYLSGLTELLLPEGLTHLGFAPFGHCNNLHSVTIPSSLSSISYGCFSYNTSLSSVIIPEGVDTIKAQAFLNCPSLLNLSLPATLTVLEDSAFFGITLDTLRLLSPVPPTIGNDVFTSFNTLLVVPCGSSQAYHQHPVWGLFSQIIEDCNAIEDTESDNLKIYLSNGHIVIEGAEGETVQLFDLQGRQINTKHATLNTGVYLVKIGNRPAQKILLLD